MRALVATTQNVKKQIQRTGDAINEKDRETFMGLQDPDIVHYQGPQVLHGVEVVTDQVWSALEAFPDLTISPEATLAADDIVALWYTARETHTGELNGLSPTDKEFQISEMKMYRVGDRKVAEIWAAPDQLGLLTQLGVVEPTE